MSLLRVPGVPGGCVPSAADELEERLARAFANPREGAGGQLIIVAEPPEGHGPIARLLVFWDEWAHLCALDRSEVIMRAFRRTKGQLGAVRISVAMGLTLLEAAQPNGQAGSLP